MNIGQFTELIEKEVGHPVVRRIIVIPGKDKKGRPKKEPKWERNQMTPEEIGKDRGYAKKDPNPHKVFTDYSIALKHCPGIWMVDVDEKDKLETPLVAQLISAGCYSTETTKGFHFYIKCHDVPDFSNELKVFKDFDGDFLGRENGSGGNNSWETKTRKVEGNHFTEFKWDDLKKHLLVDSMNSISKKDKKKKVLKKKQKEMKDKKAQEDVEEDPEGFDTSVPDEQISGYLKRISIKCHYDDWLRVGIALFNIYKGKNKGLNVWMEWSKQSPIHDEDTTETKYDTFKSDHPDPLGWKSLRAWANRDDPLNPWEALYAEGGLEAMTKEMNKELMFNKSTCEYIRIFKDVGKHEDGKWGTFKAHQVSEAYKKYKFWITTEEGKKVKVNPFNMWSEDVGRRDVKKIAFDPRPEGIRDPNIFNIWQGYNLSAEEAQVFDEDDAQPMLDHIFNIWCGGRADYYDYVLNWFAFILQKPWIKQGTLLALQSEQGGGKGVVFEQIGQIMGTAHFTATASMNNILGDFNGGLEGKVLIDLDEAFWGGEKQIMGKMKNLITEKAQTVNKKCKEAYDVANSTSFSITTNNSLFAGIEKGDRRYMCLKLDDKYAGIETDETRVYFGEIRGTQSGGDVPEHKYGALAKVLYNRDLSGYRPRKIPRTELLQDQIERGWNSVVKWWKEMLTDGTFGLPDYDKQYKNCNGYDGEVKKTEYTAKMEYYGYVKDRVNGRITQEKYKVPIGPLEMAKRKKVRPAGDDETEKQYIKRCYTKHPWRMGDESGIPVDAGGGAGHHDMESYECEEVVFQGKLVIEMEEKVKVAYKGYYPKWLYETYVKKHQGHGKPETYASWSKEVHKLIDVKEKRHGKDKATGHRDITWEIKSLEEIQQLFNKSQQFNYQWSEAEDILAEEDGGVIVEAENVGGGLGDCNDDDGYMFNDSDSD